MALTYILVQRLVPETTSGGFFLLVVGFFGFFFLISLIWFYLLQLKSEAPKLPEYSMFGGW